MGAPRITIAATDGPGASSWTSSCGLDLTGALVGRAEDIARAETLLDAGFVLTLTGPLGVGKSRVAAALADRWQGIVRWHDLAATGDMAALDVVLADQADLLVLDGADTCLAPLRDRLVHDLPRRRDRTIVVTSRSALGIAAERRCIVGPLETAAADAPENDVLTAPATVLLLDRLARITDEPAGARSIPALRSILAVTAGVPLSIAEMAAWSAMLSLDELAGRLEDVAVTDTAHGPFQAAVDTAVSLVPDADRDLLVALSVFAGRFDIAGAEMVSAMPLRDVLAAVRRLIEGSWLDARIDSAGTTYGVLAPTRRILARHLATRPEATAVHQRHLDHVTGLAERGEVELLGADRAAWVGRLTATADDLEAALQWALGVDPAGGLRLAAALWLWWLSTGRLAEGRLWIDRLRVAVQDPPPRVEARGACAAAVLAAEGGDYDEAARSAALAVERFTMLGDEDGLARVFTVLGSTSRYLGRHDEALRHFESALESRRSLGDPRGIATALNNIALMARDTGDLVTARARFEESLVLKRRLKDLRGTAIGLANLSDSLIRADLVKQAQDALFEAALIATDLGDRQLVATIASNLGDVALLQGEPSTAVDHFTTALDAYDATGGAHDVVPALVGLARALEATDRSAEAVARLRKAEALSTANDNAAQTAEVRAALARLGHDSTPALPGGLTRRQAEILSLVATGASNKHLASQLRISIATVERHLATIYQKLGLSGRVDAARYALDHGLAVAGRPDRARAPTDYHSPGGAATS